MRRSLFLAMMSAALLAGCASKKPPVMNPQMSPDQTARELRDAMIRVDPTVLTGTVSTVMASQKMVEVSDVSADQFKADDVLSFIDPQSQRPIATGKVVNVLAERSVIQVSYDAARDGRAPAKGDIAVRFAAGK